MRVVVKYMVLTSNNLKRVLPIIIKEERKFDKLQGFKCLGNILINQNRMSDTIQKRIQQENRADFDNIKIFRKVN